MRRALIRARSRDHQAFVVERPSADGGEQALSNLSAALEIVRQLGAGPLLVRGLGLFGGWVGWRGERTLIPDHFG
jgi:hypothetical protein